MKPKVYITRALDEEIVKTLEQKYEVAMWPEDDSAVPRETLLKEVEEAEGLITMLSDRVDEELLQSGKKLKVIANLAVGYDNMDLEAAKRAGVTLTNTPDVLTETTAELAFSLMMAVSRRIVEADTYVRDGKWQSWSPYLLAGTDLYKKTVGIIGMGSIGTAFARRAKGFDMNILYHTRSRKEGAEKQLGAVHASLDKLLEQSDFVVNLAPLTDETRGMLGKEAFGKMKSSAYFINAGRGQTVNEQALIDALASEEIAGAALDVFEKEPIGADHPLLGLPNVVVAPHIGSASVDTRKAMMGLCAENVDAVLSGNRAKTPIQ